jgi:predicted ATP-dependent protease
MASNDSWGNTLGLPDIEEWIRSQSFESTADVKIPPQLVDQVIGQEDAVTVIKKAAGHGQVHARPVDGGLPAKW